MRSRQKVVVHLRRAAHLSPRLVALVAAGGACGSGARYAVAQMIVRAQGWPWATFVVNLVGAFLLGVLLELLVGRGEESPVLRRWRLGLGTGFLGGFTTFSSLALEVERFVADGRAGIGVAYGLVSLLLGGVLALTGVLVAARFRRGPALELPVDPDAQLVQGSAVDRGDHT